MRIIFLFLFCVFTSGAHASESKIAAQPKEETQVTSKDSIPSLPTSIPSLESQLSSISKAQMDYVTKFNKLLDLVDKREKRVEAIKAIKGTFTKDMFSLEKLEFLFYLTLKLMVVYLLHCVIRISIKRMISYHMENMVQKKQKNSQLHKLKIHKAIIEETISPLILKISTWVLRMITAIIILDILKVNVFPLLFGFSLMCIAIAVASKNMLQDLIHGIITIMKGIIAVGDVVKIGDTKGTIAELNLRSMVVRLSTGEIEVIPFSTITRIINYSREYRTFRSEVLIGFKQDISVVDKCFHEALVELRSLPFNEKRVDSECTFQGISEFNEYGYKVLATIKYAPDPTDNTGIKYNELVQKHLLAHNVIFPEAGAR